ncbi:hypothetical protein ASC77_23640 [Nocardioides sp. Root1257]|uniref:carboxymuconolactone decarboxylase family protein n=1 Tax=unclassified Nocardioides TaxID=2615069 RepID=UPI0006F9F059|nr:MULTISPECIES: carboxymuconolactone decarboxylase family protein [unclassified Nocardioides]KQW42655.1 hypothetical protein ASC77_23640 [Nocardioides sp. Root1257]KRC39913.1 hypothetical protein ASE24_23435 [Nocardioides sp. Root224]
MAKSTSPAAALIGDFAPKIVELTEGVLFSDIWERPGLSKRDRSLITVAALVTQYRPEQLTGHMKRAVENGVTVEELVETMTHLAFYAGWPGAMSGILAAKALFDPAGHVPSE